MPAPGVPLCRSAFHYVRYMGPQVVLLGIDMRSERSKARILPEVGGANCEHVPCPDRILEEGAAHEMLQCRLAGMCSQLRAAMLCCRTMLSAAHTPATDAHRSLLSIASTHQAAYELFEETIAALPPGPQHLVVLSGVPLIFPAVGAHPNRSAQCSLCSCMLVCVFRVT